jgi:hypothetical protein
MPEQQDKGSSQGGETIPSSPQEATRNVVSPEMEAWTREHDAAVAQLVEETHKTLAWLQAQKSTRTVEWDGMKALQLAMVTAQVVLSREQQAQMIGVAE